MAAQPALAAIALGSNLPSRFGGLVANLEEAVRRLGELGRVTAVSRFRTTTPVGDLDQPDFMNGAALLETIRSPLELLRGLLALEQTMGRDRGAVAAKGPRTLDLDLLLYRYKGYGYEGPGGDAGHEGHQGNKRSPGSLVLTGPELTLPHPALHERRFVLEPLAEIAPGWMHPVQRLSMLELLQRCAA